MATKPKSDNKPEPLRAAKKPTTPTTAEAQREQTKRLKAQHSVAFEKLADK